MSKQGELNKADWAKWRKDTAFFLLGLVGIYFGTIAVKFQEPFYEFNARDLIPNPFMWGAIAHYFSNTIQNLLRKWGAGE